MYALIFCIYFEEFRKFHTLKHLFIELGSLLKWNTLLRWSVFCVVLIFKFWWWQPFNKQIVYQWKCHLNGVCKFWILILLTIFTQFDHILKSSIHLLIIDKLLTFYNILDSIKSCYSIEKCFWSSTRYFLLHTFTLYIST